METEESSDSHFITLPLLFSSTHRRRRATAADTTSLRLRRDCAVLHECSPLLFLVRFPSPFSMRILGAYLLAVLGGNETPDKAAIVKILDSVGASADEASIEQVLSQLKGKDLEALIEEGSKKISSMPAASAAPAAGGAAAAPKVRSHKTTTITRAMRLSPIAAQLSAHPIFLVARCFLLLLG